MNHDAPDPAHGIVTASGRPLPLGCVAEPLGHNFAIFSRHAKRMRLLLFDVEALLEPWFSFDLDPSCHRTGDVWHVRLAGIPSGTAGGRAVRQCAKG